MASEFNISMFISCLKGNFKEDGKTRQFNADMTTAGKAGLSTTITAMTGSQTLHGRNQKPSAMAATTTTLPACTYNNGSSGVGATLTGNSNGALSAQDGVSLVVNQRLLVKDQASGLQNGLYTLTTVGDGSNPYVLTRVTAMDTTGEFVQGAVYIESGSVSAGFHYTCTNASAPTLGSTAITFAQSCPGTVISQGNLTTPGWMLLQNLDSTNFIDVGPETGGVCLPKDRLKAGESCLLRLTPNLVLRAVANTSNVMVDPLIFET